MASPTSMLRAAIHSEPHRIVFFAFDFLHHDGEDLRGKPLVERRALLRKLIKPDPKSPIQFSDHVDGEGAEFFEAAARLRLEGIISNCGGAFVALKGSCNHSEPSLQGRKGSWLRLGRAFDDEP
jgi:ATP-dependent DNA ligase